MKTEFLFVSVESYSSKKFGKRVTRQLAERIDSTTIFLFKKESTGFYYLDYLVGFFLSLKNFLIKSKKYKGVVVFSPYVLPFTFFAKKPTIFVAVDDYEGETYVKRLKKIYFKFVKTFFVPFCKAVVCPTRYILNRYLFLPKSKLFLLSPGVETSHFQPSDRKTKKPLIYYHGKLRKEKCELLIKALPYLKDNYEVWLIGSGRDEKYLRDLAKKLKVDKKVKFLGPVEYEKLKDYLEYATICVHPFGLVSSKLFDYMSAGKAIVALKGPLDEFVTHKKEVFIVDKNPKSLANGIKTLLENKELREKLGRNARKLIQRYDWNRVAKQYKKIFLKILRN